MRFQVRHPNGFEADVPFDIQQINRMVRENRLSFKSLARLDRGQSREAAQAAPGKEWIKDTGRGSPCEKGPFSRHFKRVQAKILASGRGPANQPNP
jgi:hypothetical protein